MSVHHNIKVFLSQSSYNQPPKCVSCTSTHTHNSRADCLKLLVIGHLQILISWAHLVRKQDENTYSEPEFSALGQVIVESLDWINNPINRLQQCVFVSSCFRLKGFYLYLSTCIFLLVSALFRYKGYQTFTTSVDYYPQVIN